MHLRIGSDAVKNMTSDAKIAANRKNSQRSSGPKTAVGKSRAKVNATRHGLAAVKHESEEVRALAVGLLVKIGEGQTVERKIEHAINLAQSELDLQRVQEARIRILEMMAACPKSRASSSGSLEREKSWPEETDDLPGALFPSAVSVSMVEVIYADAFYRALSALQKLHRYERNAWLKRNRAIQQLMQVDGVP
jgi:hypothetical protein